MNDKEKYLIQRLRINGRENINDIAKERKYPVSSVYDTLHKLEEKGIIEYRTRILFEKTGFPVKMIISLKTTKDGRKRVQEFLLKSKNTNTIYRISPGPDYYFEAVFKNYKDAQEFLDEISTINEITDANIHNILDVLAYEKFLTSEEHFQE